MSKQEKPPKQRKMPVARRPETKAEHMQMFLAALELAPTPTLAAQMAYVARSTVYGWRDEDPEFARKWDEAQKVGVERVERSLFERAIEDSDTAAIFILRAHKPELYARHAESVVAAKAEDDAQKRIDGARQRLIQLGYLPPLIEGDYEEVNATPTDQP